MIKRTIALAVTVSGCAHRPVPGDFAHRLLASALDITAGVIEREAVTSGAVGCALGPVVGSAARTGAAFLRGSGALVGFSFDPSACGAPDASIGLPGWLPTAVRGIADLVPDNAHPALTASVDFVVGAALAVGGWVEGKSPIIIVPTVEVSP